MSNLLTRREAAEYLTVSYQFLKQDAAKNGNHRIGFIRLSKKAIRYDITELDAYIEDSKNVWG